jgi:hypothetical protein
MIHDKKFFQKEEILRRAEEYEFPNPIAVEYFAWDCELTAQLQSVCDDLILKGGAATQLHLPLQKQRGSKDVDIVTLLELKDIQAIIDKTSEKFGSYIRFVLHNPKKPTPNMPLQTYFAHVPSQIDTNRKELEVKIDFLCKCPTLNSETLFKIQTYAIETQTIKCSTAGTLTGDKLLSLAKGSIGLDIEENYPKQIYDVDALIQTCDISEHFIDDFVKAIDCLVVTEASYRQIDVEGQKVLKDIRSTMQNYSLVDMPKGDSKLKKDIDAFQQFYVNGSQRTSKDEWSTKALRISFFTLIASLLLEKKLSKKEAVQLITRCKVADQALRSISGSDIPKIRNKILALQKEKMQDFTVLRGKPLQRVFWQVLTIERLTELESIIQNL